YAMDAWFGQQMERAKKNGTPGIYYARYMDDVVILAHTRWQLRKQVRALNQFFNEAGFCQHPDKTFIGRTARGYDWMGAQMSDVGVEGIAHRARANHLERLRRLYEQVRRWPAAQRRARMSQYRTKWIIWACSLVCAAGGQSAHAYLGTAQQFSDAVSAQGQYLPTTGRWGGDITVSNILDQGWSPLISASQDSQGGVYARTIILNMLNANSIWSQAQLDVQITMGCTSGSNVGSMPNTGMMDRITLVQDVPYNVTGQQWHADYNGQNPGTQNMRCGYSNSFPRPNVPEDASSGASVGGNASIQKIGSKGAATLHIHLDAPTGTTIKLPSMSITLAYDPTTTLGYLGLFGNGTVPSPPNPPMAGDPPNCTAITGVNSTNDFGTGTAGAVVGKMQTTGAVAAHNLSLTCNAGANGSVEANATLYVTSSMVKSSDNKTLLASATDWLGLRLKLPASPPLGNGKIASGQTLGDYVVWNG
ncbi:hypothetical protein I5Q11_24475, partial [Serratia ureilytica]|nr:hypothetical protein [Serratia ureilytica]